jgi:glucosamine 6-phosphate synthetase-like amidotransferase/phosphosugar isomerase protein
MSKWFRSGRVGRGEQVFLPILCRKRPDLRCSYRQWLYPVPCIIALRSTRRGKSVSNHKCYEHIKGQKNAWNAALKEVDSHIGAFGSFFDEHPSELIFASCGSPYHLGQSNATFWRERLGLHTTVFPSSEVMLLPESTLPQSGNPVLLIASRSGETTETLRAVETFAKWFPGVHSC